MALTTDVVHEQGEMDTDGGHPTVRGLVVVGTLVVVDEGLPVVVDGDDAVIVLEEVVGGRLLVVVWLVGCRVVVVVMQLVKPDGFRLAKVVAFEQVPPLTKLNS